MAVSKLLVAAGLADLRERRDQERSSRAVCGVDREKVTDIKARLTPAQSEVLLQVGRRALRVRLTPTES
jgi:hypothetical protein